MTEYAAIDGGRIAYDVIGDGPLVVLSHGIGDHRQVFRFLAPALARAGYRVVRADLRGHGESSLDWPSVTGKDTITRTDIARDLQALIRHLGGPAIIVGHSISGGAATIAAAEAPELVSAIVEINPITRNQQIAFGKLFTVARYRNGMIPLMRAILFKSLTQWVRYLDAAYPVKPADYDEYIAELSAKLREPGRLAEFVKAGRAAPADAGAQLGNVTRPALIVMGAQDPDFVDPRAEGEAVAAAMPSGVATVAMLDDGGHYPHAGSPDEVAELILAFLAERVRA